jgi:hypothetical protein
MTVNAAPLAKFQTPAARPPELVQDGSAPAAHVGPVEKQVGRCGARVEVEVFGVQAEVRGRLEARQEASGPSFAVVEGAAGVVSAAVGEIVGRVMGPAGNVGGGGERLSCGLELVEVGAGGVPVAGRPGRAHSSSGERLMVRLLYQPLAEIDLCSSCSLEHFYVSDPKKATKKPFTLLRGELVRRGSVRTLLLWRDVGQARKCVPDGVSLQKMSYSRGLRGGSGPVFAGLPSV